MLKNVLSTFLPLKKTETIKEKQKNHVTTNEQKGPGL